MNYYKIILIALLFFLLNSNAFSQPVTEWVARYNSPGNFNDDLIDMVLDKEGNTYITGNTGNPLDIITLKFSSSGNLLWSRIYNGPANKDDEAVKIAIDDSGFVYVEGMTFDPIQFTNFVTLKYSPLGNLVWTVEYNFADSTTEAPNDMIIDSESNIYVVGRGGVCGLCPSDYLTLKYDKNGNLLWSKRYHGEGYFSNFGWTLALDNLGRVIVSGRSADKNNTYYSATLVYNTEGNLLHLIKYDSADGKKISTDYFGNIYLGGNVKRANFENQWDFFLNKYDSSGKLLWNQTYNTPNTQQRNDYLSWMSMDVQNDNIYYTGSTIFFNQNGYNFILFKFGSNGDSVWKRGYTPLTNSSNTPVHLTRDKYNNFYITGSSNFNTPYYRFLTVKYDSAGNFIWEANYLNILFFNHYGKRVLIDSTNSVFVGGTSYGPESGSNDIVLIKYSQITNVESVSNLISEKMELFQNYPNPFNPVTYIEYQLTTPGYVKISLFDMLGKEIDVLKQVYQNQGRYKLKWNASAFSSGMYFYRLDINGNFIDTKKLILLK
ncbi:MAG TPA: T9SS type A sorting domain-containing protein [Ignavibacteria bacterium]|nr:T9SS type A sorting domain-containing protein [Ignavibacteria bacterium]HRK00930.1 T9SS type A sorting domain-containing protein [Ignavibacteria bacterium]